MSAAPAPSRLIGVLLAAGRSRRMGRTKQLMPWTTSADVTAPLVATSFDAIAVACVEMVVVVGHEADAVRVALGNRLFHAVAVDPDAPMFDSIQAGLAAVRRLDPVAGALVHPADHPEVAAATLRTIVAALPANPTLAVMPAYEGRGGHPAAIPAGLIEPLTAYAGEGGLRQYWIDHPHTRIRVEVPDATVVRDLDRPADA